APGGDGSAGCTPRGAVVRRPGRPLLPDRNGDRAALWHRTPCVPGTDRAPGVTPATRTALPPEGLAPLVRERARGATHAIPVRLAQPDRRPDLGRGRRPRGRRHRQAALGEPAARRLRRLAPRSFRHGDTL